MGIPLPKTLSDRLATRVATMAALAAVVAGILVGSALTLRAQAVVRQQVLASNLDGAKLLAALAAEQVQAVQARLHEFATQPVLLDPSSTIDLDRVQSELTRLDLTTNHLERVVLVDLVGTVIATSRPNREAPTSVADREWLQQVLATRRAAFGLATVDPASGQPVVPYAVPVLDASGSLRAVLAGDLSLASLQNFLYRFRPNEGRAVLLDIRGGGMILAHPDAGSVLQPVTQRREAVRRLQTGDPGTLVLAAGRGNNQADLASFAPVPGLPWGILVEQPFDAALAAVSTLGQNALIASLAMVLPISGLSWWLTYATTRPLRRLRQQAAALHAGDLAHRTGLTGRDEVGELGRAFDLMAAQVQAARADLQAQVHERTARLEEANAKLAQELAGRSVAEADVLAINTRLRHALHEVSEREEVIRRQAERQRLLNEFARMIGSRLDLQSIFGLAVHHLTTMASCQWCGIASFNKEARRFRFVAVGGQPGVPVPPGYSVGDTILLSEAHAPTDITLRFRGAYVIDDLQRSSVPHLKRLGVALRTAGEHTGLPGMLVETTGPPADDLDENPGSGGSLAAFPIVIDGRSWGTVAVAYAAAGEVTTDRLEFLDGLTAHLAVAIKNSQLYGELRDTLDTLQRTQDQIIQQERLRALGEMASGIAHDLNNALVPVIGFSELMVTNPDGLDDPAIVRQYLNLIYAGGQDAAGVVRRLREFYRPREEEAFTPVDLNELIDQVIALTQPKWKGQAQALGQTIHVEHEPQPVSLIAGDEISLREALTNLIFNAVDAMPQGGSLTLRTREDEAGVAVEVVDSGVGMPEDVRRRCLEPFFTTKGERGSGLGLAMVYGIIGRHNGTIEIESEAGCGTTIRLRLPRHVATPVADPVDEAAGAQDNALRILVVDDEPVVRQVTTAYLTADGHTTTEAASGGEALERLQAGAYDVVVTDRAMPDLSGDQLAKVIKEHWTETRVVLLTGFGDLMVAAGELPDGIDAVLGKPVNRDRLRRALTSHGGPASEGDGDAAEHARHTGAPSRTATRAHSHLIGVSDSADAKRVEV